MKKFTALMLALMMSLSLVACGNKTDDSNNADDANTDNNTEQTGGTLVLGTSADYAPYEFMYADDSGTMQYAGIDISAGQYIADELGKEGGPKGVRLVALSGPTHAEEVAIDLPTTIVSASKDMEAAAYVQEVFTNNVMRVYTNEDIKGVELSGAMKNVIALGVGISTGLGYGDNARAALITRGIAEIARLGVAMGCNIHTFAGLAGIGDLIVTATSMHSRNNRAGILIGKGETPENAVKEVGMVVEGMNALPAALELAERYQVEMPIIQTVNAIVNKGMSAAEAVKSLMERGLKNELPQEYEK